MESQERLHQQRLQQIREARQGNADYMRDLQNQIEELEYEEDVKENKPSRGG